MLSKVNLPGGLTRAFGRGQLLAKKHSPEILLGLGLVGVVAGAILAVKATLKIEEVRKQNHEALDAFEAAAEDVNPKVYSPEDYKKDEMIIKVQSVFRYVKLYAPATTLGVAGIVAILGSHGIMQKRTASLLAAYGLLQEGFASYRKRIVDELGPDFDKDVRFGLKDETVEVEEENAKGKKKKVKTTKTVVDPNGRSDYARFFDEYSIQWRNDPNLNMFFLKSQQNYANDLLKSRGHLFLNEVYNMLGFEWTPAGQMVGWVVNGKNGGDGFVDFGLYDPENSAFVNRLESSVLLDFNVDGVVYDLI